MSAHDSRTTRTANAAAMPGTARAAPGIDPEGASTASEVPTATVPDTSGRARAWILALVLAALVFVAFGPSSSGQWLKWDDDRNFLDHEAWRGLSPAHLSWMFTTFHQGPYQPLSWLTLAIDHALWGMDPFGYHVTNVVLHAATAVVFFFLARRVIGLVLRRSRTVAEARDALDASRTRAHVVDAAAFFATAFFALHPLRVESVAWITERRDVLSGLFLMPCVTLYLRAHDPDGTARSDARRWFAWSLALYAASLLSKGLGMTLPVVLLLLDVFVLARWKGFPARGADEREPRVSLGSLAAEKWAYILLATIAAALAWYGQKHHSSVVSWSDHTARERITQAFFGLEYYAEKAVWPTQLSPLIVLPTEIDPLAPRFLVPILAVLAVATFAWFARRRVPVLLGSLLAYAAFASPVLGFTQAGPQLVADRYSYLPSTALALSGGGALAWMLTRPGARNATRFALVAGLAIVPVLGWTVATRVQCRVWHDTVSIWERASRVSPESTDARRNLTVAIQRAAEQATDPAQKIEWYERGLRECADGLALRPDAGLASNAAGMEIALADLRPEASANLTSSAHAHVLEALRLGTAADKPLPVAYENHAILSIRMGHAEEAVPSLEWLCAHDPDDANYALMLGQTLVMLGRYRDALAPLDRAQKLDPRTPVSWMEAGTAFKSLGQSVDARRCYERGIAIARSLPPESGVTPDLLAEWTRLLNELPP